ncbi:MAG: hypothetical protein AAF633_00595 [Chloroflexota bacterium]
MSELILSPTQKKLVAQDRKMFIEGAAGTGKTTLLYERLRHLLNEPAYLNPDRPPSRFGSANGVLVLLPERSKYAGFQPLLDQLEPSSPRLEAQLSTIYQLARDGVEKYWSMIAPQAGFEDPQSGPTWLTYDMAQTVMWEVVTPMLRDGYFADLRLRPQQIISQLLDNLNRAASNRITVEVAIDKQLAAWAGDQEHRKQLYDAKRAAELFIQRCFNNNLLDTSLIMSVFDRFILQNKGLLQNYLGRFAHLLVDNIEEQTLLGQAVIERLIMQVESAHVIYDEGGGYKRLLAASPDQVELIKNRLDESVVMDETFGLDQEIFLVANKVRRRLGLDPEASGPMPEIGHLILDTVHSRYRREMLELLGPSLANLIEREEIDPSQVAIIIPYLDGALQFKLLQSLEVAGLPYALSRRRGTPKDVPYVRAWVTWLRLAFYDWPSAPTPYDVAEAFSITIQALDPVRASLVAEQIYSPLTGRLLSPDSMSSDMQERIGSELIEQVERLVTWLNSYQDEESGYPLEIDFFFYHLFDQLLASPGYFVGESQLEAAAVCSWLIDLATRFKALGASDGSERGASLMSMGERFIAGIYNGLVSSDPPDVKSIEEEGGIFIGSIQAFLLSEKQVDVQVWLEASGNGWWDLPRQPLSNPFVLDKEWSADSIWTLADDARIRNQLLSDIVYGLCGRCRTGIVLAMSQLDRRGGRQDGPLWRALA